MSTRKLLLDHFAGFSEVAYFDETDKPGSFRTKTEQDCGPLVEAAKIMGEQTPGKDFRHAAVIPLSVLDQSYREGWFHDKKKWREWANNPDNRKFRTWAGRL